MHSSLGRAEAERRIDEVRAIIAKMIHTEVKWTIHHDTDDLIQDAMIGVFTHIDKWDPNRSSLSNFVWLTAKSWVFSHVLARDQYDCHKVNVSKLSLDAPYVKSRTVFGRDRTLADIIPLDYDIEEDVMVRVELKNAIDTLERMGDKRIKDIILKRNIIDGGRNQREIANDLGISHQRVCQLEKLGLDRLRRMLRRPQGGEMEYGL